jgi:hypothetical protein
MFPSCRLRTSFGARERALGLLFVSLSAAFGVAAFYLFRPPGAWRPHRAFGKVAIGLAVASVVLAYASPVIINRTWAAARPSATARLEILSPLPGDVFQGDSATVPIPLRLVGGKLAPSTSTRVASDIGHIHVYLDGKLISMTTALSDRIAVGSGSHVVRAEFVAADHGPFNPPVEASASFRVTP